LCKSFFIRVLHFTLHHIVFLLFLITDRKETIKDPTANVRVNISMPKDLHRDFVADADKLNLSFSAYVRLCCQHVGVGNLLPFKAPVAPLRDDL
jgi:hypothetical protein